MIFRGKIEIGLEYGLGWVLGFAEDLVPDKAV
jgi:hypothetical protein